MKNKNISVEHHQLQIVKSPYLPPEFLSEYEKTLPGAADRILCLTEKQVATRLAIEKNQSRNSTLCLVFAFLLCFAMIVASVLLAVFGFPKIALAIATTTILGIARTFLPIKKNSKN